MNRQIAAIVIDTLREARARKLFLSMLLGNGLSLAGLYWMARSMDLSGPASMVAFMGQADPRYLDEQWVGRGLSGNASAFIYGLQLLGCLMHTMSLVPALLEPARNAWLVSHPVSRTGILLGRFLGCLVIATLSAVFTFGGAWAVVGMKTNVWHVPFFFGVATTLLLYVSLASAMLLLQLVSSSPMLMATGLAAVAALNGAVARPEGLKAVAGTGRIHDVVVSMAEILPRPVDVATLTDVYVQTGRITHYQYLWTPALFCVICLGLASWRFSRKNL